NNAMTILVTGSTGTVGSHVLEELRKGAAHARVIARKQPATPPEDVEVAVGDLLAPVSVEKAIRGVDKLYLLNAVVPDELTQRLIAYGLAKKHRLKQVVYHSVFRADEFKDVPHFASKSTIEAALKAYDVPYTIIRPNYFHQNDEALKEALLGPGIYPTPLAPIGVASVDVLVIAVAAAIALFCDRHLGNSYYMNTPLADNGSMTAPIF